MQCFHVGLKSALITTSIIRFLKHECCNVNVIVIGFFCLVGRIIESKKTTICKIDTRGNIITF